MEPRDLKYSVAIMLRALNFNEEWAIENEEKIFQKTYKPGREFIVFSGTARKFLQVAKYKYLLGYGLDEIREDIRKSCVYYGRRYEYELLDPDLKYIKRETTYDYEKYTVYLSLISLAYLLDIEAESVVEFEKLIHIIKGRDILIDTILNALVGTPIEATERMATNPYKTLAEVILEPDKEKAQTLIETFMKKEWFKNSSKFMWRSLDLKEEKMGVYEGYYAYETIAIARIKGLDMSRLMESEHFPADLAYYRDGKNVDIVHKEVNVYQKEVHIPTRDGSHKAIAFDTSVQTEDSLDFRGGIFKGNDFTNLDLTGANFDGVNLEQCLFDNSKLHKVNFNGAYLYGSTFRNVELIDCDFREVTADGIWVSGSTIENCQFDEGEFHKANFSSSKIENTSFKYAKLYETGFDRSEVRMCDFIESGFGDVSVEGTTFVNCQFAEADISMTEFTSATLEQTDITVGIVLDQDE